MRSVNSQNDGPFTSVAIISKITTDSKKDVPKRMNVGGALSQLFDVHLSYKDSAFSAGSF
jgi:hypothetical protein